MMMGPASLPMGTRAGGSSISVVPNPQSLAAMHRNSVRAVSAGGGLVPFIRLTV